MTFLKLASLYEGMFDAFFSFTNLVLLLNPLASNAVCQVICFYISLFGAGSIAT
jgi:hypothetical protein